MISLSKGFTDSDYQVYIVGISIALLAIVTEHEYVTLTGIEAHTHSMYVPLGTTVQVMVSFLSCHNTRIPTSNKLTTHSITGYHKNNQHFAFSQNKHCVLGRRVNTTQ